MDSMIIAIYCICDDLLRYEGHVERSERKITDAEVMTIALVASYAFGGNYNMARWMLAEQKYIPLLGKGHYSRRLHKIRDVFIRLFYYIAEETKANHTTQGYALDSFPISACDNYRIRNCRLYQGVQYRGYIASKRRYFYGLRLHLLITTSGQPVEFFLVPGNSNDAACLGLYDFDLPRPARVVADKAFTFYALEDLLADANIEFASIRKSNSKRSIPPWEAFLRSSQRHLVESVGARFNARLTKHIHATSQLGFELKCVLFVLALVFDCL